MSPSLFTALALSCFITPLIWWAGVWLVQVVKAWIARDENEFVCSDWEPENEHDAR